MQATLFYFGRFLKKLADDQCSSITKGSIYHIKHMYIHHFTTVVDWLENWHLMEVSTMFYICRYCVFTWWGSWNLLACQSSWVLVSTNHCHPVQQFKATVMHNSHYNHRLGQESTCMLCFLQMRHVAKLKVLVPILSLIPQLFSNTWRFWYQSWVIFRRLYVWNFMRKVCLV